MQSWTSWVLGIVSTAVGAGLIGAQAFIVTNAMTTSRELGALAARMALMEEGKSTPKAKDTIEALNALAREITEIRRQSEINGKTVEKVRDQIDVLSGRVGKIEGHLGIARQSGVNPVRPPAVSRAPLPDYQPKSPSLVPDAGVEG